MLRLPDKNNEFQRRESMQGISMQKILKRLFSRLFFVALAIIVQVLWFIGLVYLLGSRFPGFLCSIAGDLRDRCALDCE